LLRKVSKCKEGSGCCTDSQCVASFCTKLSIQCWTLSVWQTDSSQTDKRWSWFINTSVSIICCWQ